MTSAAPDDLFFRDIVRAYVAAPRFLRRDWLAMELQSRFDAPDCRFALLTAEPGAGKSALVTLGCTVTAGIHNTNTVGTVNVPDVLTTGVVDTTADSLAHRHTVKSRTSADVHDADILSGLITATEIKAVSTTIHDTAGFHRSAAGSEFVDLVVNGTPISGNVAPNTTIDLPGVGRVVKQHRGIVGLECLGRVELGKRTLASV